MSSVLGRVAPGLSSKFNLLVDLLLLLAAIVISTAWTSDLSRVLSGPVIAFMVAAVASWVVTATALRHYDPWTNRTALDDVAMLAVLVAAEMTVLAVIRGGTSTVVALPEVLHLVALLFPALVSVRLVARQLLDSEQTEDAVLVVGTGPLAMMTAEDIERARPSREVLGFLQLPHEPQPARVLRERVLGTTEKFKECLETLPVSEVYFAAEGGRAHDDIQACIRLCETIGVPFALPAYNYRMERARPADARSLRDGYLHYLTVDAKPGQMALKRLFDIAVSAVALWALLPLLLTVAAIIKLSSRGPVFFRQQRVGLHGRTFHMLKFRSMVVNAEELKAKLAAQNEMSGPVFKMKNDPRVTGIGRFIRKFSIDELPQLVNVLRGDMTIVGPRPPVPSEVAKYQPWQRRRLSVRPGLTCIWQVSGRNQISFEDWMYLDMRYIDHWNLKRDIDLVLKTVPVVLTGRGAS